jgi:hypothetical protein
LVSSSRRSIARPANVLEVRHHTRCLGSDHAGRRREPLAQEPGPAGSTITTQVKWDGATLVFETQAELGFVSADRRETWTLSPGGKILTKVLVTRSPLGETRQTFVIEKR